MDVVVHPDWTAPKKVLFITFLGGLSSYRPYLFYLQSALDAIVNKDIVDKSTLSFICSCILLSVDSLYHRKSLE